MRPLSYRCFGRTNSLALLAVGLVLIGSSCRRKESDVAAKTLGSLKQTSESCRECHKEIFDAWHTTDHARANRLVDPIADADALAGFHLLTAATSAPAPEQVLGSKPLWQPLIPWGNGRWQAHEMAYDPARKEWFNVFGSEKRQAGEWGHWTGRGMNWNSMCAQCHMTGFEKRYDAAADSYHSTWTEQGIGCVQCHGSMSDGHGTKASVRSDLYAGDRQKMMQTCAPCHARNERLTRGFKPGDNYFDHYRVTLPVERGVFWPDGQQRDEDFNWTSMLLSRMGHVGVTCLDCHDPHTTKTVLPAANNQLCLQCHASPGRVLASGSRAIPIDPLAHSHHADGSTGNSCVACHMPTTTYMQRAPRHDHGWLKPDPLMTEELGIPNACNRCHEDKTVHWAIEWTDKWYAEKLDSIQRARARAIASAQTGKSGAADSLLELIKREDIPAWRATYLQLLRGSPNDPRVAAVAEASLKSTSPLERAAAVQLVAGSASAGGKLNPLLEDETRLVRLEAAWTLTRELPVNSTSRRELDDYLDASIDQPAGRLRRGQDFANRGQLEKSREDMATATAWDPNSPVMMEAYAFVLASLGRVEEAAEKFHRAAELQPTDAPSAFQSALAFSEAGRLADAEKAFHLALSRDPALHRAWYNLGLLYAGQNRLTDAKEALQKAESEAPSVPDYSYALSTVLLRMGDRAGAVAAVNRTLAIEPSYPGARELLQAAH